MWLMLNLRLLRWAAAERLTHLRRLMGRQTGSRETDDTQGQLRNRRFFTQLSWAGHSRVPHYPQKFNSGTTLFWICNAGCLKTHRSADSSPSGRTVGLRPPEFQIKMEHWAKWLFIRRVCVCCLLSASSEWGWPEGSPLTVMPGSPLSPLAPSGPISPCNMEEMLQMNLSEFPSVSINYCLCICKMYLII